MATSERITRIAANLKAQAQDKARQRAEAVFGPQPSGTTDMGRKALLDMVRRYGTLGPNYDAGYIDALLTRMGPENFREIAIALWHGDETVWPLPGEEGAQPVQPPADKALGQSLSDVAAQRWLARDETASAAPSAPAAPPIQMPGTGGLNG